MSPALALFVREWRIARRIGGGASVGAVFFLILIAVMPFALGPDLNLLARLGPAILWIAALLATLLGLDRLFQSDRDDGSLDLLLMSRTPLESVVIAKCAVHWALTGLPLVAVAWQLERVRRGLHGAVDLTLRHWVDRVLAGEEPDRRPRRAPPFAQDCEQLRRQHHISVALPLATFDPERHAPAGPRT